MEDGDAVKLSISLSTIKKVGAWFKRRRELKKLKRARYAIGWDSNTDEPSLFLDERGNVTTDRGNHDPLDSPP